MAILSREITERQWKYAAYSIPTFLQHLLDQAVPLMEDGKLTEHEVRRFERQVLVLFNRFRWDNTPNPTDSS